MSRVISLAQDLLRIPSVTPDAGVALDYCENFLSRLGFSCQRMVRGEVPQQIDNLYAVWGNPEQLILFCGHLDVVPTGEGWSHDPFAGDIVDEVLYGRGAVDMKGSIAAYFAALETAMPDLDPDESGLALLLTGDEEGEAIYGVRAIIPELVGMGEHWIGCLTGEPTSQEQVGDAFKHGRRGSLNGRLEIRGTQGHTGYPARADNAAHRIIEALSALRGMPLDNGNADFEPSWLAITSVDVGNFASNVIPGQASAQLNFRFNTEQSSAGLCQKTHDCIAEIVPEAQFNLHWSVPSEPYLSPKSAFIERLAAAITETTGLTPQSTTVGGTSDSRFIHSYCPVVDFGLCGKGMHEINESVALADLHRLEAIYTAFLRNVLTLPLPENSIERKD